MKAIWIGLAGLASATAGAASAPVQDADGIEALLATTVMTERDPARIKARCDLVLDRARTARAALEARRGPASFDADYMAWDRLYALTSNVGGEMYLLGQTALDKPARDAGAACAQTLQDLGTEIGLSRPLYDRLAAVPLTGLDPIRRRVVEQRLLKYRLAGVDKDAATRARVEALNKEITAVGLEFDRNISEDRTGVTLTGADALAGLPADYVAAHKPDAQGRIALTTSYPDVFPVLEFGAREATRKAVADAFNTRAWPANRDVLPRLVARREALAKTLGHPDYATLVTADKMAASPDRVRRFIAEVDAAAKPAADTDTGLLLAKYRQIDPRATALNRWSTGYLSNLVRKERFAVDQAEVRRYFTVAKGQAGIFRMVKDLFGTDIVPWQTPVWAPGVSAWEMRERGKPIGRFYLDLSPRPGKYNHAAMFSIRSGPQSALPIGALVMNMPATGPLDHADFKVFLHEFGHLIHFIYGNPSVAAAIGDDIQWDFIEAPSQLLEEWAWDYDTLRTFASDDAGRPIPSELVAKMNAGRRFGEARGMKGQLGYAAASLAFYTRPAGFDPAALFLEETNRYATVPMPAHWHSEASFGHLNNYSAIYYTYVWSRAIASDLLTRFRAEGLRNPATAMAYRRAVLAPGGTVPADALIRGFLRRDWNADALREELKLAEPAVAAR